MRRRAARARLWAFHMENVDSFWNSKHHRVDHMDIDPDAHSLEPCHVAVAHSGYSDEAHVDAGCSDPDRHQPHGSTTGGISGLQMPDRQAQQAQKDRKRAQERAEKQAATLVAFQDLGARTQLLEDEEAIAEALRLAALDLLQAPPEDDCLLPSPEGHEPHAGLPHQDLAAAVGAAGVGDIARALCRHYVDLYVQQRSWQAGHYPHVADAARRLSKALGEGPG